jgi:phosphopantetheinyl transferase
MPSWELLRARPDAQGDLALHARAGSHPSASQAPHASRSYRFPLAIVAWHNAPVGVDIERVDALGVDFARSICSPLELEDEALIASLDDDVVVASMWSGKEALAKALGDAVDYDPRRLDSPLLWPHGVSGRWRASALSVPKGYVAWLVWQGETSFPK